MPSYEIKTYPTDVIYVYDGSLAGFLCCVHESFYAKEMPRDIVSVEAVQMSLHEERTIKTDSSKAKAVRDSIHRNISRRALLLLDNVFLCHHEGKELKLLAFLIKGFKNGGKTLSMLGDKEVADVLDMEKHMLRERHLLTGFIRFADYGEILGAVISPKNFVLPLLAEHFMLRFPDENFMIYDKTHKAVLVRQGEKVEITIVEELEFKEESGEELHYQNLWKNFYKTIGIKERFNPKCRMTMMPKRYWENMIEMSHER